MLRAALFLAATTASAPLLATTWAESKLPDPFAKDAECDVANPASSGSYVYQWPEKYDQVFWPFTDSNAISVCPTSGFVTWMTMFELQDEERRRIEQFLQSQPRGGLDTREARVQRLVDLFELRDLAPERRITALRAFAFLEEGSDPAAARAHRERALELIRAALAGDIERSLRMQYLFVTAAYEREFGRPAQSDTALAELEALLATLPPADPDAEDKADATEEARKEAGDRNYAEYLRELVPDIRRIEPGGALAPPPVKE